MLFVGGFEFTNPPPEITPEGIKPYPNKGARRLHSRTAMFYTATAITPAMCMRLTGVGSQYLIANVDAAGEPLDGAKTYRKLPWDIPAARKFWSSTYDNQSRPRCSQRYPLAAASGTSPGSWGRIWFHRRSRCPPSPTASLTATGSRLSGRGLVCHPALQFFRCSPSSTRRGGSSSWAEARSLLVDSRHLA
jgi:hypothetical protein